ncbi:TPA: hypothetical protein L6A15_28335 [Pseudomonas aeruginosa]|nr:hypothetical protein [Pseudomonas putida]HBP6163728.1 hypothetical protein [Pseudomonas aeruginosa]
MDTIYIFKRQVIKRSNDHKAAMHALLIANVPSQMASVLRQELDSMVRVIFLLSQPLPRRMSLIMASVNGEKWRNEGKKGWVTDRQMVDFADGFEGWIRLVYDFCCRFVHLSSFHDYNSRDPMQMIDEVSRKSILDYCRRYHGGPNGDGFHDLVPYLPDVLEKISENIEFYIEALPNDATFPSDDLW